MPLNGIVVGFLTISFWAPLVLAQAVHPINNQQQDADQIIELSYVKYHGYTNATAGIKYFRGIQYAAAPTCDSRWQKPIPIEEKHDFQAGTIYNATKIAPACPQFIPEPFYGNPDWGGYPEQGQSEDCLILDVLSPLNPVSESLPILVNIHGGGYDTGDAQFYPGDALVNRSNGNIIFISIQYRLGFLGFLGGSEVAQEGTRNAGLHDQRAALAWIQRHARAFGGDASRVTIWGGSAGGGSVTAHLIAYGGSGEAPFSAAIVEYPWWQPFLTEPQQETTYRTAMELSNCSDLACLRELPYEQIMTVGQGVLNASYPGPAAIYGTYFFGPVVDNDLIRNLPGIAFSRGHFHHVPLIVDHAAYEGYMFTEQTLQTSSETASQKEMATDLQLLFPSAGRSFLSRLLQLYPRLDFNSTLFQRQTWFGDYMINCPTYTMASNAIHHFPSPGRSSVWKLIFGAGFQKHGATRFFLTSDTTDLPRATNETLVDIMMEYWIAFVVSHDPNGGRRAVAPYWPSYNAGGNDTDALGDAVGFSTLHITDTSIESITDPDASARCDFFGSNRHQIQN